MVKIDAQFFIILKSIIHSSLKYIFHAYGTSLGVWEQVKMLYTNDTPCFYNVCQNILNIVALKHLSCKMAKYFHAISRTREKKIKVFYVVSPLHLLYCIQGGQWFGYRVQFFVEAHDVSLLASLLYRAIIVFVKGLEHPTSALLIN